jgi:hypothetical protein
VFHVVARVHQGGLGVGVPLHARRRAAKLGGQQRRCAEVQAKLHISKQLNGSHRAEICNTGLNAEALQGCLVAVHSAMGGGAPLTTNVTERAAPRGSLLLPAVESSLRDLALAGAHKAVPARSASSRMLGARSMVVELQVW